MPVVFVLTHTQKNDKFQIIALSKCVDKCKTHSTLTDQEVQKIEEREKNLSCKYILVKVEKLSSKMECSHINNYTVQIFTNNVK